MPKNFAIPAAGIKQLAAGRGSCLASDKITVDGCPVGWMYREAGDNDLDSGWRFFAGDETDGYCGNPDNFELYDVNTIAIYDPAVIPLLDAPIGAAYRRDEMENWCQ